MQYFLFTVNEQSWPEHFKTGIAAINDPSTDPNNIQGNAQKQKALCELASVNTGDILFFYFQQKKEIMGVYEASSKPFFDTNPLVNGGFINQKFPIRVAFKQKINFPINLGMAEVWHSKDKGSFWSIQQQRGDSVGRHACICLTKQDGGHLLKMFYEKNPVISKLVEIKIAEHKNEDLPLDYTHNETELHYEAVLQAILLRDLGDGKHKDILGDYDYFVPFFPTSSQKEIDILLFKHKANEVLWYEILELKQSCFSKEELNKVMGYEDWLINSLAVNARSVHSIGIANKHDQEVKEYVNKRTDYGGKKIRLVEYQFDNKNNTIILNEVSI